MGHSSSGGQRGRSSQNRSQGGDRNRQGNRGRSRRPEPKPTLGQKILGFFGLGAKKKTSAPSRSERAPKERNERSSSPREKRAPQKVEVTSGRLYVGNLNYDTTDSDLTEHFSQAGTVQSAEVVSNPHNNRSKGFGFVEMGSIDEAKSAVDQFDGQELAGRQLIVNGAKADTRSERPSRDDRSSSRERSAPRERRPRREDGGGRSGDREPRRERREGDHEPAKRKDVEVVTSPNLVITSVNTGLTEEDLVDFFRGIGTMTACEIVKNDTGESTGANIVMTDTREAQRAVEIMNGKTFMGQKIKISGQKGGAEPVAEAPAAEEAVEVPAAEETAEAPAAEETAGQEPSAEEESKEDVSKPAE